MSIIDIKLIDAYTTMVLVERYVLSEGDRKGAGQLLVPEKYVNEVSVKVAERTIEVLSQSN